MLRSIPLAGGDPQPYAPTAAARLRRRASNAWALVPSPDGSRIAADGIYVVDVPTLRVDRLTRRPRDGGIRWSRDGRSIAYSNWSGTLSDVYTMSLDGSDRRRLTADGASIVLDWSPDGELVLFRRLVASPVKPEQQQWELWVVDADGGRKTRRFGGPALQVILADRGPPEPG